MTRNLQNEKCQHYLGRTLFIMFMGCCSLSLLAESYDKNTELAPLAAPCADSNTDASEPLNEQILFPEKSWGYDRFRIPALLETKSGVLLAFAEGRAKDATDAGNIDTVLRRSLDGGKTWLPMQVIWDDGTNTCGNPTVLQDPANGRVWLFSKHTPGFSGQRTIWSCFSDDDGASWSAPHCHYPALSAPRGGLFDAPGPGRGIVLKHGPHSGRLVIPAIERNIYSDDHGVTWQQGGALERGTSETQIVELSDGTLLRNDRATGSNSTHKRRMICMSNDQGASWMPPVVANELPDPICMASIIALPSSIGKGGQFYVFANPSAEKRTRMTVQYSYDDCKTWPVKKVIHPDASGYSCLTGIGTNSIGLLYEVGVRGNRNLCFAKFGREICLGQ